MKRARLIPLAAIAIGAFGAAHSTGVPARIEADGLPASGRGSAARSEGVARGLGTIDRARKAHRIPLRAACCVLRAASAASPIRIGVSNVQTGPSATLGKLLIQGSMAYFQRVNNQGGIHGRRIEVILKDDRYEPDPAIRNTFELITQDRVFFLFDYVGTPTLTRVLPLLKYFEAQEIVNVAPFTGAEPQRKPPYDRYVFNIRASYAAETRRLVEFLYASGCRRIGFLGQADAYGKSGETGVTRALRRYGLEIAGHATYRRNQSFETSMKTQVGLLRSRGANAVIAVGVYAPCAAFIRDARLAGWSVPIANVSFVGAQPMLDLLRASSQQAGVDLTAHLINSQVVPLPAETRYPMVRDYRAHVPQAIQGAVSLEGWLNAVVVTEALRRAGPRATRAGFIRAMESLGGWDPGLGVKLTFGRSRHQGLQKVWLTKTSGGRWVSAEEPLRSVPRAACRVPRPLVAGRPATSPHGTRHAARGTGA